MSCRNSLQFVPVVLKMWIERCRPVDQTGLPTAESGFNEFLIPVVCLETAEGGVEQSDNVVCKITKERQSMCSALERLTGLRKMCV